MSHWKVLETDTHLLQGKEVSGLTLATAPRHIQVNQQELLAHANPISKCPTERCHSAGSHLTATGWEGEMDYSVLAGPALDTATYGQHPPHTARTRGQL